MNVVTAIVFGILTGAGVHLMVRRDILELALGSLLVSNGAVLLVVASGFRVAPSRVVGGPDPLAQALALTAIVIGFGTTVFLLRVMLGVARSHDTTDIEDLVAAECVEEEDAC